MQVSPAVFKIQYDRRVKDDIASLSSASQKRIKRVVEEKLITKPELFGKPLRYSLLGFRSLRIGDYRVIYIIEKNRTVFVVLIAHRKNVYKLTPRRTQ